MIELVLAMLLAGGAIPYSTPDHAWNRSDLGEAEFAADSEACAAAYLAALPRAAVQSYRHGEIVSGGLNQYSGTSIEDEAGIEAWDECFLARGYTATFLSRIEQRQIYGRYITDEMRHERLYAIAIAEDRRGRAPARPSPEMSETVTMDHPIPVAPD